VLDDWEVENIFDAEYREGTPIGKKRAKEIRREHEGYWSTGTWDSPNYVKPDPPITEAERLSFQNFCPATTQVYACVLPGEIIRRCVEQIEAGLLDPAGLLDMRELIVDEYQDLNPMDLQFVESLAEGNVRLFVAGDDDQSIYAFRYASPAGIQKFIEHFPGAGDHLLTGCFRCATAIVRAADDLILHASTEDRIPKDLHSLWATAHPAVEGVAHRWRLSTDAAEASAIAESCAKLIEDGLPASDIMLLISDRRILPALKKALQRADVSFQPPKEESWVDKEAGRYMLGLLRVVCSPNDHVAHRLVLGCRHGVGITTCKQIARRVMANNLVFRDLFYEPLTGGNFTGRSLTALERAREALGVIRGWSGDDLLGPRREDLAHLLVEGHPGEELAGWDALTGALPDGTSLRELRDYVWAENSDQRNIQLTSVHERLGLDPPAAQPETGVRVLTMHGAKGLQAKVVFIPGLEEGVLPSAHKVQRPGLVLEGARLLYMSLTRARAAVVMTLAGRRTLVGKSATSQPSRYCSHLGGRFTYRKSGLTGEEARAISQAVQDMG
jgi:DNA helicase-2/ATP-dependent DNA helicase PcrA